MLEEYSWQRVAAIILALVLIGSALYAFSNVICWGSVRTCQLETDCPDGSVCVLTSPEAPPRCVPRYCADIDGWFRSHFYVQPRADSAFVSEMVRFVLRPVLRWMIAPEPRRSGSGPTTAPP